MKQTSHLNEFIRYASANVIGMIGLSVYILADTFFISKGLGANGLAALNLAIPVYSFMNGTGLMLGMGGATRYSMLKARHDTRQTKQLIANILTVTGILALFYMLLGAFFSEQLTRLLGADAEIAAMTNTYLKVILLFAPAFLFNNVALAFVRNDGSPRLAMAAMLSGSFANIVFDYIFIFPFGMGIFGAVLATGTAPVIGLLILSAHFRQKKSLTASSAAAKSESRAPRSLLSRGFRLLSLHTIFSCVSLGLPSLITEVSSGIVMIIFNMLVLNLQGNVGVAAYGVIANLSLVLISIYTGIAQGIQPIISSAYGKDDHAAIRQTAKYGIIAELLLSALIYGLIVAFAPTIAAVFNSEGNALLSQIAVPGLRLYFTAAPFVGFNIVISTYFTSTGKALPAQLISLLRGIFLIVPLAFLMALLAGITGIWLTFPLTEVIVCCISLFLMRQTAEQHIP